MTGNAVMGVVGATSGCCAGAGVSSVMVGVGNVGTVLMMGWVAVEPHPASASTHTTTATCTRTVMASTVPAHHPRPTQCVCTLGVTATLAGIVDREVPVMAFTPFTKKDAPAAGPAGAKEAPPNDAGKPAQGDPTSPAGHPDQAAHTKDMPGGSADHAAMHKGAADSAAAHQPPAK